LYLKIVFLNFRMKIILLMKMKHSEMY